MNALVQTDQNVLFNHGTWARITGRFLYAAATTDTLLDVGGASTVTLTQNNLPATATFTIPALSLSIDDASTAHTHTTAETNGTTGNVTGSQTTLNHRHGFRDTTQESGENTRLNSSAYTNTSSGSTSSNLYTEFTNLQHTHDFTIPALTTGGMSANETHTHTGSTVASIETISDFGFGTAFDIIPPYVNLAVWYRAN
jgi:hypothetical protein